MSRDVLGENCEFAKAHNFRWYLLGVGCTTRWVRIVGSQKHTKSKIRHFGFFGFRFSCCCLRADHGKSMKCRVNIIVYVGYLILCLLSQPNRWNGLRGTRRLVPPPLDVRTAVTGRFRVVWCLSFGSAIGLKQGTLKKSLCAVIRLLTCCVNCITCGRR